jgi:hypothetical protein
MKHSSKQGSAIITVIIFITIILMVASVLIFYIKIQEKNVSNLGYEIQAYQNAKSVLSLALQEYEKDPDHDYFPSRSYYYSLFGRDSTFAEIKPWGYFLLCHTESKIKEIKSQRTFLIGNYPEDLYGFALVIGRTYIPVTVSGTTRITGDVAVGRQGVKPGILAGKRYKGERTVYGNVYKDEKSYLPQVNRKLIDAQIDQLSKLNPDEKSLIELTESKQNINRIYLNNRIYSTSQNEISSLKECGVRDIIGPGIIIFRSDISLNDINLFNQITVYSEHHIALSPPISIEHVLFLAKNFKIKGICRLRGQFFASENLSIEDGTKLLYPSILGVISEKNKKNDNTLFIGKNVEIEGSVIISKETDDPQSEEFKHIMIIDPTAIINGITYSDNYTELNGTVYGTVFTNAFQFYLSPTTYINWINDGEINRPALLNHFIYPIVFTEKGKLVIIKEI